MMKLKPPTAKQKKKMAQFLGNGEEIVCVTGISNRYFWIEFIKRLPFALLLVGLPSLSRLIHHKNSLTYVLTNRRCLIIQGIFTRKLITAPLNCITHVTVEQNFWERFIYNTGQIVIITAGYDQREIVIEHFGNPVSFKILIEDLTDKLEDGGCATVAEVLEGKEKKEPILRQINPD